MRTRILEATIRLIRSDGVAAITTKKVALAAGCAEGTIFSHFTDKGGLLAAVLSFGLPETQELYDAVQAAYTAQDVRGALLNVTQAMLAFYRASYPLVASALADRALFAHYASAHREGGTGPRQAWELVGGFFAALRDAGRIDGGADIEIEALALVGACQNAVWVGMVNGDEGLPHGGRDLAERIVDARLSALGLGSGRSVVEK